MLISYFLFVVNNIKSAVFLFNDVKFRSADHSVCMFDRRNLTANGVGSPVHKFEDHKAPVLCVQAFQSFFLHFSFFVNFHASS